VVERTLLERTRPRGTRVRLLARNGRAGVGAGGADGEAGRLQADLQAVGAQVALLGGVVLRVDEDRVVRRDSDAGFTPDTDRLVEIDDPVRTPIHRTLLA